MAARGFGPLPVVGPAPAAATPLEHLAEPKRTHNSACVVRLVSIARALVADTHMPELSARQVSPLRHHLHHANYTANRSDVPRRRNGLYISVTTYALRTTRGGFAMCAPPPVRTSVCAICQLRGFSDGQVVATGALDFEEPHAVRLLDLCDDQISDNVLFLKLRRFVHSGEPT